MKQILFVFILLIIYIFITNYCIEPFDEGTMIPVKVKKNERYDIPSYDKDLLVIKPYDYPGFVWNNPDRLYYSYPYYYQWNDYNKLFPYKNESID